MGCRSARESRCSCLVQILVTREVVDRSANARTLKKSYDPEDADFSIARTAAMDSIGRVALALGALQSCALRRLGNLTNVAQLTWLTVPRAPELEPRDAVLGRLDRKPRQR